ncbi:hypothetical protein FPRO05_14259 [Fusarium proliferatum]|uniref:Uncharacterized protein n=1 Tax=Gibberella intermedia TaxID=948311 RepID=A0A365MT75_GIBIN|nr:hypothetical protein FPRO05_14259 [Fusarium proliferatum]
MSSKYSLNVHIDPKWVKAWSSVPGMKLCFATAVGSGASATFSNVVAYTHNIAPNITIEWGNSYRIAGSTNNFSNGAKFTASTDKIAVKFGSKTEVNKDWSITTNPDDTAPEAGFLFTNKIEVAAVLYREIQNEYKAIYISHVGPMPRNSREKLTPKQKVYVWFSDAFEDETMIDDFEGELKEVEYSGKTTASVKFDNKGTCVTVILDAKWIRQFRGGKMNLCTAFSVTSNYSNVSYNVIATHEACKTGFAEGAFVSPSIYPLPIKFGQAVSLLKDWTMETPNPSESAPSNGWLFINKPSASALVFKTIRNRSMPIYVTSAESTPPPGQHTLIPTGRVLLFFADAEARTSFNAEATNTSTYEYSYIEHPRVTVYFNAHGDWETVSEESSDAVANDAMSVISQRRDHRSPATSEPEKAHL